MKITQLLAKPKLIAISIDDEDTVKAFGEPIEFYIWDRQPMDKFIKLAQLKENDMESLMAAVKELVLDEEGNKVLGEEMILPNSVLTKVITKVVESLGK